MRVGRAVWRCVLGLLFAGTYWCLCGVVLWHSYSMTPLVRGRYYARGQALALVEEMGLITTILTGLVWLLAVLQTAKLPRWRAAVTVGWRTSALLGLYVVLIIARTQIKGAYNDAAFLGHVNEEFLSESSFLSYLLCVAPIMGCVSGVLYYLQWRIIELSTAS